MSGARVQACLRAAMARWAASQGTAQAAAELGVDPSTLRRKRDQGHAWTDADIAAAIAHELDQAGSSGVLTDLLACEGAPAALGEPALRAESLRTAATASLLSSAIAERLADGNLSPRDAGEIHAAITAARTNLRATQTALEAFLRTLKGPR